MYVCVHIYTYIYYTRLLTNDLDDEWLQSDIQKLYGMELKSDFNKVAKMVEGICAIGLCEIYDLAHPGGDLAGSMLRAAIRRLRLVGKEWHHMLPMAVAWNHEEILRNIMGRLKMSDPDTQVVSAICVCMCVCTCKQIHVLCAASR